ncbi:TIGR04076 family protein [Sediminispirochaeta bajacaliforniensis]|uniref:TIGR04076 family protein n=1 Tax=Sediminispirochaeta bajacaliforniensis TaxID=148 RepID=UPI000371DEB4|nr:TIGR04076 family protein [Sediminispirochaeta bajacaliforniensis]
MRHSVQVTVESIFGHCSAGLKKGDSFIIRDHGCMKLENSDGFCPELFFVAFPTCMSFAAGGSLRWEQDGVALVACPDPEARVVARIERV